MTEAEFWSSNPTKMQPYIEAYKERQLITDSESWTLGLYIKSAIASALDKRNKYPDKPYMQKMEDERIVTNLDENEIEVARRQMMLSMGLPISMLDETGS